jgi:hypothetical protein
MVRLPPPKGPMEKRHTVLTRSTRPSLRMSANDPKRTLRSLEALIFQTPITSTSLLFWCAPQRRRMAWQFQFLAGVGNFRAIYLQDGHVVIEVVPNVGIRSVR